MKLSHPKAIDRHYAVCHKIDQHNMCRQQALALENNIDKNKCCGRTDFGTFEVIVANSWLCLKLTSNRNGKQEDYYEHLSEEMIEMFYNEIHKRTDRINECAYAF